jgi:hypothetical protein
LGLEIEMLRRRTNLSWSHHKEVAADVQSTIRRALLNGTLGGAK